MKRQAARVPVLADGRGRGGKRRTTAWSFSRQTVMVCEQESHNQ
jgi:hypothetical protein